MQKRSIRGGGRTGAQLAMALAVVMVSCSTVKVRVPVMRPAEINLRGKTELVIGSIYGPDHYELTNILKDAISSSGRFKLVDRQNLDKVMAELQLSQSDLADGESRKKLGKLMTGSIMLIGNVEQSDYQETVDTKKDTCTKTEDKKTVKYPCTKITRRGTAKVVTNFDVIDVETGENLKPKRLTCQKNAVRRETDGNPPRIDGDSMVDQCRREVVAEFMKAIAPWHDYVDAPFLKDGDIPMLEMGINYAQRGEWDEAIKKFREAVELTNKQPGLAADVVAKGHWNLGLSYQYTFQFEKAREEVKRAFDMTGNKDFLRELDNIKRLEAEQAKLQEQLGTTTTADGADGGSTENAGGI